MGSHGEVMHCYEQIASLAERMLILASTKQWGGLPTLEEQYRTLVDRLKVLELETSLDRAQSTRKYQLLRRINANSSEILGMVIPQMKKLIAVMASLEKQQRLHQAYQQPDDAHL